VNPATLLGLWDVCDSAIVTTRGALFAVGEVIGVTATSTHESGWQAVAEGLYAGLRRVDDGALLQVIQVRGRLGDETVDELLGISGGDDASRADDVLAYQRGKRAAYLKQRELRDWRSYLVYGAAKGLTRSEFAHLGASHAKQKELLAAIERQVAAGLERANIRLRRLGDAEIVQLIRSGIDPSRHRRRRVVREQPRLGEAELKDEPVLAPRSVREQLVPGNVEWDADWVKVDRTYFKVLAAKQLPPATSLGLFDRPRESGVPLAELDFDFRLVTHIAFPDQAWMQRGFRQRRRFVFSLSKRGANQVSDAAAEVAEEDLEILARELAEGEKLLKVGLQAVVWADSLEELQRRADRLRDALAKLDVEVYEESWAHDRELFKALPGMSATFDRWRLVKSAVAADLLPVATASRGDRAPVIVLEDAETRQPFGWNLRQRKRPNDNFLILGASGAGKSVFVNMLLAYGILSGPTKGRVLGIDYAGPTKSSFKVAAEVFGGKYISISGDGHKINPWPRPSEAVSAGKLKPATLAYLTNLTNLLLYQTGEGPQVALSRALVQSAIQRLYERWGEQDAPLYSDYIGALASTPAPSPEDRKRLDDLVKLGRKMLSGPEGELLNYRTTAETEGDFLVYDLYGLRHFEDRVKSAVALVVTNQVRNTAFDGRPDRYKYIMFEEAANLLQLGMRDTVEELLTTARAHGTSVCVITQEYDAYRRSGIDGVVNLNTTSTIFMSHAEAANALVPIVQDFQLNEAEAAALRSLRAVRGQYSELLFKTTIDDEVGDGAKSVTAKVRLYLSPFDYQVVTSDAKDRAEQIKYRQSYPNVPLAKVLEYLAYGKTRAET